MLIIMVSVQRDSAFEWSQTELPGKLSQKRSALSPLPGFLRYLDFEKRVNNQEKKKELKDVTWSYTWIRPTNQPASYWLHQR